MVRDHGSAGPRRPAAAGRRRTGLCDNPGVTSASLPVGPDDVLAARELLRAVIRRTPLLESGALSALAGGPVFLKCENLQRAGSFKVRGNGPSQEMKKAIRRTRANDSNELDALGSETPTIGLLRKSV